jgi:hypothetical protein
LSLTFFGVLARANRQRVERWTMRKEWSVDLKKKIAQALAKKASKWQR